MSTQPTILRSRLADAHNAVTTVQGGRHQYRRQPCDGCPWRVDQTGSFPAGVFRISAPSSYDQAMEMFGCHMSGVDNPTTCAGFLLRGAHHNTAYRVSVMRGRIDPTQVSDGGCELHASYRAMAVANGVDPDDPVLGVSRPTEEEVPGG